MNKAQFISIILISSLFSATERVELNPNTTTGIEVLSSDNNIIDLNFTLNEYYLNTVIIDNIEYSSVKIPNGASLLIEGAPDLTKYSKSIIIPDDKKMKVDIIDQNYIEYENILISPSKGNLSRDIDPSTISYNFSSIYTIDSFFPSSIVTLKDPYILRDFRAQVVEFNPIQYNPVTNVLRIYTTVTVQITEDGIGDINVLNRSGSIEKIAKEYESIYSNQFLNFDTQVSRFDYLVDHGKMLVISYGDFLDEMQPLVDWKNLKGIPTEIVNVSDVGSNSSSITSYVETYYNNQGLTFLLLVGDIAQMPSPSVSGSASDVSYGCILGNDFYPEVIVGRISGNSPSQITTQVERSINYERYPQAGVEWYDNALGIASNQGPGFGNMTDDDFNDYLWDTVLSDFTYDSYQGIYDPSGSVAQGTTAINNGVSLINYTGHGSISSWGNGAALSTSQVNQLTNTNMLPFVITVGCNVGEFNNSTECFSEAWLRATSNGEPTGGIGHFGSTISQSWEPPMHGQYGMNLILTESYDLHLTRSLGGITTNGCMYMNDAQGSSGINETKYWTYFGDPSVNIRTAPPSNLNVFHDDVIMIDQNELIVDVGENGALVALSRDGNLLSSTYSQNGVAILTLGDASATPGELDLLVTGFNSFPYESTLMVIAPDGAYVVIDNVLINNGSVDEGHLLYGSNNDFDVQLTNVGSENTESITVTINSDSEYLDIIQGLVSYYNIQSNESITLSGFETELDWNVPNEEMIIISFTINNDQDTWSFDVPFLAQAPLIELNSINGSLDPGENTTLEISLLNNGDAPINYPIVTAEGDMYVTVNYFATGNAYYWDNLQGNNQETLTVDVTVSANAPIGYLAEIMISITNLNGGYLSSFPVNLSVGEIIENFESGFTESLNWDFSGNANWEITESDQYEGFYSALSGSIDHSQTSSMSVSLDVVLEGNIEFYYRVASEYSTSGDYFYDGLEFYIDNAIVGQYQPTISGETPWNVVSYPVDVGFHTFRWSYVKDGGPGATDIEEDCSWVDHITFPTSYIENNNVLGDINGDGTVNIQDIILAVNMVIGNGELDLIADINSDGLVNVLDIVQLTNIILE